MQNINKKKYEQYVKQLTPTHSLPLNMAKAFLTGGLICLLGQVILNTGQVFGIGCKIFTIAGPVILYGILSAWGLGVIYYILKILEVIS